MEPKVDPDTVNIRFGGETETPVCSAQETLIYPKRAKTSSNDWVFVLNQENVQQALRVEKCTRWGPAECTYFWAAWPSGVLQDKRGTVGALLRNVQVYNRKRFIIKTKNMIKTSLGAATNASAVPCLQTN